eukprot:944970-Pleurochrysis_carterae.AAC.1
MHNPAADDKGSNGSNVAPVEDGVGEDDDANMNEPATGLRNAGRTRRRPSTRSRRRRSNSHSIR